MLAGLLVALTVKAAEPAPAVFQSGPGRFEIAAADVADARLAVTIADELWRALAVPLGLPEGFSTPVLVRIASVAGLQAASVRALVEGGGIVSVRVATSAGAVDESNLARALARGLLLRLAVARHGPNPRLAAPAWLEQACVGWWQVQREPAHFDAVQHEAQWLAPPALEALLVAAHHDAETRANRVGAVWLMAFLRGEAAKGAEWPAFVQRLLGGEEPLAALAASFPGRFRDERERELWWQTGWHHAQRARSLPALSAAESRRELETLARFVFAVEGGDAVRALPDVLAHGEEPLVRAELAHRATTLNRLLPALHPFYRNAGLSLAAALATAGAKEPARTEACRQFVTDWRDGDELAAASASALDDLESKQSPGKRVK